MNDIVKTDQSSPIAVLAERLSIDAGEMQSIIMSTIMPDKGKGVTNEQFVAFVAVANNYSLDPLKKEIYAFPSRGGGIQPIVSIDGWLRIITTHPDFNGMELKEDFNPETHEIFSVTCTIHKKGLDYPTVITEYLAECYRNTEPWKKKIRMLRHKATIQCGRYAFGLSGIMEQDEAEAITEIEINPKKESALKKPPKEVDTGGEVIDVEPEQESAEVLPKQKIIDSMLACTTIGDLDTVKDKAAEYPEGDDRAELIKCYKENKARILLAEDKRKLAEKENKQTE